MDTLLQTGKKSKDEYRQGMLLLLLLQRLLFSTDATATHSFSPISRPKLKCPAAFDVVIDGTMQ